MRALTPKRILTNPFFSVEYFTLFCCINHATIVLQELWRFAIIRELPSSETRSASEDSILSDNGYVSVVKQPGHRPFAFSRIPFRPRSKAFSTLVKNLFD